MGAGAAVYRAGNPSTSLSSRDDQNAVGDVAQRNWACGFGRHTQDGRERCPGVPTKGNEAVVVAGCGAGELVFAGEHRAFLSVGCRMFSEALLIRCAVSHGDNGKLLEQARSLTETSPFHCGRQPEARSEAAWHGAGRLPLR